MKTIILMGLFTSTLLVGCISDEQLKENKASVEKSFGIQEEENKEVTTPIVNGTNFIENITINGNKMEVKYFKDYKSYKNTNSNSKIDERDYINYWNSDDTIEKVLFEQISDLFGGQSELEILSVTLPFEDQIYSYSVKRSEIEKYLEVEKNDNTYIKEFIRKFVGYEITADDKKVSK